MEALEHLEDLESGDPVAKPASVQDTNSQMASSSSSSACASHQPVKVESSSSRHPRPSVGRGRCGPPASKSRRGVKVEIVKTESSDDHGLSEYGGLDSDEMGEDVLLEEQDKTCPGCKRTLRTGVCWLTGAEIQWALPGDRGAWCKECFNLWRLCYSSKCNQIMFSLWLDDENNWMVWELHQVASLMIRVEGLDRLTAEKVASRVASLEFAFQMFGLTFKPFELVKFRQLPSFNDLQPDRLVQMSDQVDGCKKLCLGYMFPATQSKGNHQVNRPSIAGRFGLHSRSSLQTDFDEDIDRFTSAFPSAMALAAASSTELQPVAVVDQSSNDVKVQSTIAWAISQLQPYKGEDWVNIKEGYFTTTMNKFFDLKSILAHDGDEKNVSAVEVWLNKLGVGRLVSKKYREFRRVSTKTSKLQSLSPSLGEWIAFLLDKKVAIHYTLAQLNLKVSFTVGESDFGPKVKSMLKAGLCTVLEEIPVGTNISGESWLRSVFFGKFAMDLQAMAIEDCEAQRKQWITNLESMVADLSSSTSASAVQSVVADLIQLTNMLKAGIEHSAISVADATSCINALATPRFALLREAFDKAPAGIEFASAARELLQRRASDQVGDERLRVALEALSDGAMLSVDEVVVYNIKYIEICQAHLVLAGKTFIFDSMTAVLSHTLDAIRVWSPVRLHEKKAEIVEVAEGMASVIDVIDLALCWLLTDMFSELLTCGETMARVRPADDDAIMLSIGLSHENNEALSVERTKEMVSDGSDFSQLQSKVYSQCLAFAEGLGEEMHEANMILSSAVRRSSENQAKRQLVLKVGQSLVDAVLAMEGQGWSKEGFLQEWEATGSKSALTKLLDAKQLADEVKETGDFEFGSTIGCQMKSKICWKYEEAVWDTNCVLVESVATLPSRITSIGFWSDIQLVFQGMVADALLKLLEQCEFEAFVGKADVFDDFTDMTLPMIGASLVKPNTMQGARLALIYAARMDGPDPVVPHRSAFKLFESVLKYHDGGVPVGKSKLAEGPAEVPKEELLAMMSLYTHMGEVASTVSMVIAEMKDPSRCISGGTVREDLEKAVAFAVDSALEAESMIETEAAIFECADKQPKPIVWPISLASSRLWLKSSLAVIVEIRARIVNQTVKLVQQLASKTEKHTPRYEHFINDKTFVPNLCKKHLLAGKKELELFAECVELFQAIGQVAAVAKKYKLPSPKEDPKVKETLNYGLSVFNSGKQAATVITACRVALLYTGQEQYDEAVKLLSKWKAALPGSLVANLTDVTTKGREVHARGGNATAQAKLEYS